MIYKQGDILLIPVPFTDLTTNKKRPVLVLSDDIIVAAITSNIRNNTYSQIIESTDLDQGELQRTSCIKVDKLYTLAQSIVIKKVGGIKSEKVKSVTAQITELIS